MPVDRKKSNGKMIPFKPKKKSKPIEVVPVSEIAKKVFSEAEEIPENPFVDVASIFDELIAKERMQHMKLEIIDYSETYYKTIAKKPMTEKRGGKFVQLRNAEKEAEYLVFSPSELSSFHANIIERFCLLKGIDGAYTTVKKDRFEIHDSEWHIVGGGKWTIDDNEKRLILFDNSGVYGKFDSKGLRKKILDSGKLQGYEVKLIG